MAAQGPPIGSGQQNPSTAPGTILKNRAPVSKETLKVALPKPHEADLSNGVHLIVLEDHRAPLVSFQMIIDGAGGYYDPPNLPGLAGFTATLMRQGTATKTSEQISEQLDRLAASVGVGAGLSSPSASVTGSGLTNNLDTVLALMADVLLHPSFPQDEIDRYKTRTRAGLMNQRSQPGFLAQERFNQAVYGNHPAARVSATPQALDALTRDALVEFHKAHYVPDRAVLAVAGDITLAQAKAKAETAFSAWKNQARRSCAGGRAPLTGRRRPGRAAGSVQTTWFVARRASSAPIRTQALTVGNDARGPLAGSSRPARAEGLQQTAPQRLQRDQVRGS